MNEGSIKTGCSKVLGLLDGTGLDSIINNAAIPWNSSSKDIVNMSSSFTSVNKDLGPGSTSYNISKVGLNVLVGDPFIEIYMGGKGAVIEPHVSEFVTGIVNIVTKPTTADVGKFYNYLGKQNPW
ncbi:uncharacterized protein BJ212DRAFT_1584908 [Suillus subaureus]|uniref:Uncharacterized protein n=1 Tax=Suillus subaureus TaxID=48587 RepID=A0A9P7EL48_9AGAM|nr:uncharacterized protein BJ212DRAFT_1584908 [Suillus subaureus]KAG1824932.1 hypothetical protein BJ212DRAFT_1584908 [Suillus subaureus]